MMPKKTISTRKLLSLIADSVQFRCSMIMRIVGHHLLSIACMTTALNFTNGRSSMVFSSTLITLSMRITVNSFEKIPQLYLHCLESCCSLNQIQKMRRKVRITTVSSPQCSSFGVRSEHQSRRMNPGNSSLKPIKRTCRLVFGVLFIISLFFTSQKKRRSFIKCNCEHKRNHLITISMILPQ